LNNQNHVAELLDVLNRFALIDRYPQLAYYQGLAQTGRLSQERAKLALYQIKELIEHQYDFPNFLHRPPTAEQLYAEGEPDIVVGGLIEGNHLSIGLRIRGRVPSTLVTGLAGSGKSCLLRVIATRIDEYNRNSLHETNQSDNS